MKKGRKQSVIILGSRSLKCSQECSVGGWLTFVAVSVCFYYVLSSDSFPIIPFFLVFRKQLQHSQVPYEIFPHLITNIFVLNISGK